MLQDLAYEANNHYLIKYHSANQKNPNWKFSFNKHNTENRTFTVQTVGWWQDRKQDGHWCLIFSLIRWY